MALEGTGNPSRTQPLPPVMTCYGVYCAPTHPMMIGDALVHSTTQPKTVVLPNLLGDTLDRIGKRINAPTAGHIGRILEWPGGVKTLDEARKGIGSDLIGRIKAGKITREDVVDIRDGYIDSIREIQKGEKDNKVARDRKEYLDDVLDEWSDDDDEED